MAPPPVNLDTSDADDALNLTLVAHRQAWMAQAMTTSIGLRLSLSRYTPLRLIAVTGPPQFVICVSIFSFGNGEAVPYPSSGGPTATVRLPDLNRRWHELMFAGDWAVAAVRCEINTTTTASSRSRRSMAAA